MAVGFLVEVFLAGVLVVALVADLVVFAAAGLAAGLAVLALVLAVLDLANLAKAALRRLTVLAFKRPFLTALSYSD